MFSEKMYKGFYNNFKQSNNKFLFLYRQKYLVLITLFSLVILFSAIGFTGSDRTNSLLEGINKTAALFTLNYSDDKSHYLEWAKFFAIVFDVYSISLLFFSNFSNRLTVYFAQKKPYSFLIGSSSQNQFLLKQWENPNSLLVLTDNEKPHTIAALKERGFGVLTLATRNIINELDFKNLKHAVISSDDDLQNISLSMTLFDQATNAGSSGVVHVRLDNRDLAVLFRQDLINNAMAKSKVELVSYSSYELITKQLFSEYSILGRQQQLIKSNEAWSTIVIGASKLSMEIIYYLASAAHFPEQNHLTIYCIDKDADAFCTKIEKTFSGIKNIPHLSLEAVNLDHECLAFYKDDHWRVKNLANIIIATDDDEVNLDIAVKLQDTTFIEEVSIGSTAGDAFKTNVLFALYNDVTLGERINSDAGIYKHFYSFANFSKVLTKENLIDEKFDAIAKRIHYDYIEANSVEDVPPESINKAWIQATYNDRESSRSQAAHIDSKLLALGLSKKKSAKKVSVLLKSNPLALKNKIIDRDISDEQLRDFKVGYFPQSFDTLFHKLARSEKNRWNAFHYLKGWEYDENLDKKAKKHDCLMPIESFKTDRVKISYRYDLLSILNIPKYLALAGYEIVDE